MHLQVEDILGRFGSIIESLVTVEAIGAIEGRDMLRDDSWRTNWWYASLRSNLVKRSAPLNLFTMSAIVGIWVYGRCIASFAMRISMEKRISIESGFEAITGGLTQLRGWLSGTRSMMSCSRRSWILFSVFSARSKRLNGIRLGF